MSARGSRFDQRRWLSRQNADSWPRGSDRNRLTQSITHGVCRRPRRSEPGRLPSDWACDAGAAIRLARGAGANGCGGEVTGTLHVHHEHAAAALHEAHSRSEHGQAEGCLYRASGLGQFRSAHADTVQPRSAGRATSGREGQCAAGDAADHFKVARFDNDASNEILRNIEKDIDAVRFDAPEGRIELPVKLRVHESVFVLLRSGQC